MRLRNRPGPLRGWRPQGRGGSNPPFRTNHSVARIPSTASLPRSWWAIGPPSSAVSLSRPSGRPGRMACPERGAQSGESNGALRSEARSIERVERAHPSKARRRPTTISSNFDSQRRPHPTTSIPSLMVRRWPTQMLQWSCRDPVCDRVEWCVLSERSIQRVEGRTNGPASQLTGEGGPPHPVPSLMARQRHRDPRAAR